MTPMKKTPTDERVTANMQPGVLCREGFLGHDHRELPDILQTDAGEVGQLGLTHEQLADRLEEVMHKAMATYGTPTKVDEHLVACYHEAMGRIPSPFGDGKTFPKGEIVLEDRDSDITLRFTPLSVFLIREHGFYQGRGSRYRLEPKAIAKAFRLARA
jgi:hypothetical protein